MRRESETKDSVGTAVGLTTGGAAALVGFALLGPVGAVIGGIVQFFAAKKISAKFAREEIDEISLNDCDRTAEAWRNQVGRGSATLEVTKYSDALIPLPQTRVHHYTFGSEVDNSNSESLFYPSTKAESDDDDFQKMLARIRAGNSLYPSDGEDD